MRASVPCRVPWRLGKGRGTPTEEKSSEALKRVASEPGLKTKVDSLQKPREDGLRRVEVSPRRRRQTGGEPQAASVTAVRGVLG